MTRYTGETPAKASDAQYDYTFAGWNTEIVAVTGEATYTATYSKTLRSYTITWKNYDGEVLEVDEKVDYGLTPTYDGAAPVKPATDQYSYVHSGWDPAVTAVSGDATYTATFTESVNTYTVKFDPRNDGAVTEQVVSYGGKAAKPDDPTKTGYAFGGWTTADGAAYDFDTAVTGDITLYAAWTANTYTVVFDANDAEAAGSMENQGFTYDVEQALAEVGFSKENWSFAGWATSASETDATISLSIVASAFRVTLMVRLSYPP